MRATRRVEVRQRLGSVGDALIVPKYIGGPSARTREPSRGSCRDEVVVAVSDLWGSGDLPA